MMMAAFAHRLVVFCILAIARVTFAWIPPYSSSLSTTKCAALTTTTTRLFAALPSGYQEYGNEKILQAAALCGASPDQIDIQWKGGRIVVTVSGDVYVSDPLDDEEEDDDDEYIEDFPIPDGAIDVTTLARAINSALDDDGVGLAIAEVHEIEVTTPGASDELTGIMWESYKGFDVIAQFEDPKKNGKIKTIEGRLVERNDEFTILNIKGRMKKLKNENVVSVKLPKAKKEKGVR